jgi:uncharacterized protein (DUF2141 family)
MRIAVLLLVLFPSLAAADSLIVEVSGITPGKGDVRLGVFQGPEEFPEGNGYRGVAVPGKAETMRIEINDLKPGAYSVSVFQDFNGNEKVDKNFVGKPKEPYGFSGKWKKGRASFEDALIELPAGGTEISIGMK